MKVIILCGGLGTRLKDETEYKPKPLVSVGNKPILWHIMKIYEHYGFNEFILALGYKANYIKDFFLNQKAFTSDFTLDTQLHKTTFYSNKKNKDKFQITFVDTGLETLVGERIMRCEKYIPKRDPYFMVTYGDGVSNLNIKNLMSFHKKSNSMGTVTGVHPRSKYGKISMNAENLITNFTEKPLLTDWVNGGFMIFKREAIKYFKANETEHSGLKRLLKKRQLSMYPHNGFWYAVDTFKELEDLNRMWDSNDPPWKL